MQRNIDLKLLIEGILESLIKTKIPHLSVKTGEGFINAQ